MADARPSLATCGLLLGVSVVFSRASQRTGVPIALLFLAVGMLAGSEGLGRIAFDDYRFAFRIGTLALALILFDGGLNTPLSAVRRAVAPAGVLATVGVAGTAVLVAVGAHFLGLGWREALLLGAVVSSTDAAAVFAVLRGSGLQLKRRLGVTLRSSPASTIRWPSSSPPCSPRICSPPGRQAGSGFRRRSRCSW